MSVPLKLCLSLKFAYQNSPWTSLAYHMRHTPNHSVVIWQVMQLQSFSVCIMLQSLLICPVRYKYSPQRLESLQPMYFPQASYLPYQVQIFTSTSGQPTTYVPPSVYEIIFTLYNTGNKITILKFTSLASKWKDEIS